MQGDVTNGKNLYIHTPRLLLYKHCHGNRARICFEGHRASGKRKGWAEPKNPSYLKVSQVAWISFHSGAKPLLKFPIPELKAEGLTWIKQLWAKPSQRGVNVTQNYHVRFQHGGKKRWISLRIQQKQLKIIPIPTSIPFFQIHSQF